MDCWNSGGRHAWRQQSSPCLGTRFFLNTVKPDPIVNPLDFDNPVDTQVAVGSEVTDESGTRRETLIVLPGTQATMVMPDGTTEPMTTLNVHLTEYTVGATGPAAMPAELPPQTAYTYAMEYTAEEAVAAGAETVELDPPLVSYMENYYGFATGTGIPLGSYDRNRGTWIAHDNGVVVEIVGETGGLAELDIDGDGVAEDQSVLDGWDISDHERAELLNLYAVGESLWRVRIPYGVERFAGNGSLCDGTESCGDGGPALSASFYDPIRMNVSADGSVLVADRIAGRVRRIDIDGVITTVAGNGALCNTPLGDGGLAVDAMLCGPSDVAEDAQGNLYITEHTGHRVRKIDTEGIITTVAGTGTAAVSGDGGPAVLADVWYPSAVDVGPDGSLYIATMNQVRRVDSSGIISTFAGSGSKNCYSYWATECGDGGLAIHADLYSASDVAVAQDGRVFIAQPSPDRIRVVTPDGLIDTYAGVYGDHAGYSGEGVEAKSSRLWHPVSISVSPSGTLLIAEDTGHRVRYITPAERIFTLAGTGASGTAADGTPALEAPVTPEGVAMDSAGNVYFSEGVYLRKIAAAWPGLSFEQTVVPSPDGTEAFVFGLEGRHEETLDAVRGTTLLSFGYDFAGRLLNITDGDGNVTTVHRNASGEPLSIEAPFGQTTQLTVGEWGMLSEITAPDGATWSMTYHGTHGAEPEDHGQLATFQTPRGHQYELTYDAFGRLEKDQAPDGSSQNLSRTGWPWDYEVTRTTKLGRTTTYAVQTQEDGSQLRTNTMRDGTVATSTTNADGSTAVTLADGTQVTSKTAPDPRFGLVLPYVSESTTTLPSGLASTTTRAHTAVLSDPFDPLSVVTTTETTTVNGRTFTSVYDAATRTTTRTTPVGRISTVTVDEQGRIIYSAPPGVLPTEMGYDAQGRISTIAQGTRQQTFGYDAQTGYLLSVTDALTQQTLFQRDAMGRATRQTLPDGQFIDFAFDGNGNLVSLTPPEKPAHGMQYTSVDLMASYDPPVVTGSGTTSSTYGYNLDRQLESLLRADGESISRSYDSVTGKLTSLVLPTGTAAYSYDATSGRLVGITGPYAVDLSYGYDGRLRTDVTWSGDISGTVPFERDRCVDPADALPARRDGEGHKADAAGWAVHRLRVRWQWQPRLAHATREAGARDAASYNLDRQLESLLRPDGGL